MAESAPLTSLGTWPIRRGFAGTPSDSSPVLWVIERMLEPFILVLTLFAAAWRWGGGLSPADLILALLAFLLAFPGTALRSFTPSVLALRVLLRWSWMAGLLALVGLVTGYLAVFESRFLFHWLWLAPSAQIVAQLALRAAAPRLSRLQGPPRAAVIVGINPQGTLLAQRIAQSPFEGIRMLGFFDDRLSERHDSSAAHPITGGLAQLPEYVKRNRVQLIYLSLPMSASPRILQVLDGLKDTTASIYFVPDMFITDLIQGRSDKVCGVAVISVCDTPFRGWTGLLKRGSDLLLAGLIVLLIAPLLLIIALAVRLESSGPVIFRQRRYGLDGQEICVYKFRSMWVTEDGSRIEQARLGDPRITRVGRFLRRTSLDELPQFINVLQGRMSIVGPRPHAVAHNELYRKLIKGYMVRHKVKPGITGWAQVNGQRGETDTLDKMQARIDLDLDYLRHWSLWLDLRIIARTVALVFKDARAY
ncbi:MAG: undecaprenyl-phosphate glucose phosphotransferase [Comamonadaceae bacterium]|nr:undecaprenyl-phosphate glucose phosphotransferase [Comamonadaceae bacterium]